MKLFYFLAFLSLGFSASVAQSDNTRLHHFNHEKGIALSGYDPVSYFTDNKAIKGIKNISTEYKGITYYFSSVSNKDLFHKNPSGFEPQYSGWCAYAMGAKNEKVEINPETFKIVNGKLYLFYNAYFNNTLKSWNKDEPNLINQADKNWIKLIN